ncbi:MAG: Na+/H+ antiporter NhaA [Bacteroidales bacterium]
MKKRVRRDRSGVGNIIRLLTNIRHSAIGGGLFLILVTLLALIAANSDCKLISWITEVWKIETAFIVGNFKLEMDLLHWVNDFLMAIFFFVVGLEIKREMMVGELSTFKKASLPIFAAIGGMIVPALIYFYFNKGTESQHGWGIPMATDIAFSLGVISLLGRSIPSSIKLFLTALAIVDDLGAILVLAIFYPSHPFVLHYGFYALVIVFILIYLNRANVNKKTPYLLLGLLLWYFILQSGVHATIAGVILAMTIPSRSMINESRFLSRSNYYINEFEKISKRELNVLANQTQIGIIHKLNYLVRGVNPLINTFQFSINPYVTYAILPFFAAANAGISLEGIGSGGLFTPIQKGIFFGLLFGKPIGIFLFTFLSTRLGISERPKGIKWKQIFSVGILAGIGFTMSIFIDTLAFSNSQLINEGKVAILLTSVSAAFFGLIALRITFGKGEKKRKYKKPRELTLK